MNIAKFDLSKFGSYFTVFNIVASDSVNSRDVFVMKYLTKYSIE